jgi:cell division protein ZapA
VGQVTVRVNGYNHTIGCKDGEEAHVTELIGQIEGKTKLIRSMGGQFSEARMLLHVALLLADEAGDLRAEVARLSALGGPGPADPVLADRLTRVAERIESLAGALDAPTAAPPSVGNPAVPAAGRG